MSFPLTLEPHRESWKEEFVREETLIGQALGSVLLTLHHIGSTAIPGIHAKPIIDMLAEVTGTDDLDRHCAGMERLGYEAMGEFGISGRRYFRKSDPAGVRTHQLHAFANGSPHLFRHLAFRDYLRVHPDIAQKYGLLKLHLLATCGGDMEAYINGKDSFVKTTEQEAVRWMTNLQSNDLASDTRRQHPPDGRDG